MKHDHARILEQLYADFLKGDIEAFLAACSEKMTFQVPGKSRLAGKYDRATFKSGFAQKLSELSGNTHKLEVHDILASDVHAVALTSSSLMKDGTKIEYRSAHVWRFENGKPVAWYAYPRDLYQFDSCWG
jgi:ketosteroid isomerase-like protein